MADINLTELASSLDSEDMIGFTRAFVEDIRIGLRNVTMERYPWMEEIGNTEWKGVLALGMGGSAAGGDFLSALCNLKGKTPVVVQRDYVLPSWWDEKWLVISTSHSGNTEEAMFDVPRSVTADRIGNIYVADSVNMRIRVIAND